MAVADSTYFQGHRCFKDQWSGFETIKPMNVVIGRNNTGKSHLLDLVEALCTGKLKNRGWKYRFKGSISEKSLRPNFREDTSGGDLSGNHWADHGRWLIGKRLSWVMDENSNVSDIEFLEDIGGGRVTPHYLSARLQRVSRILAAGARHVLDGKKFRRLLADRDIRPEVADTSLSLAPDGSGASNIIRRYIITANPSYPRELIQVELLEALNTVFGGDAHFTEIQVKLHDDDTRGVPKGHWEIFLGEIGKGLIPLSNSGSGLKTVLLALINLLVVPKIEGSDKSQFVFAFEELENNLHPALLRRLLQYVESYAVSERAEVFLTTHSSTALDLFGVSKNAQIVHVTHDGKAARSETVAAHFDHLGVISELGAKPSDLLQANGIIWVEGPSDCIYMNRWLDIFSGGILQEGRDYQCAFYGGSLLARTQFTSPQDAEAELVNLFRVNANIVVVCDGDRGGVRTKVKDRVRRIRAEVLKIPGALIWVTDGREIENYIPGGVLEKALEMSGLPDPGRYDLFFPRKGSPGGSYIESKLSRKALDKMDLAVLTVPHMDRSSMEQRFEWKSRMQQIVDRIASWNR